MIAQRIRIQSLEQTLGQAGRIENRAQQQKAAARVLVARALDEHVTDDAIAHKAFRALQQPHVELAFGRAQVAGEFSVVALGIIHGKLRVHLEVLRQQRARRLRHVTARAALNLREVRLADALAQIVLHGAHNLLLRQGAAQFAQRASTSRR